MAPPKQLRRFVLVLLALYAALMAPPNLVRNIPVVGTAYTYFWRGYATLFRTGANVTFARFLFVTDGAVRFKDLETLKPGDLAPGTPMIEPQGTFDTVMELRSRSAPGAYGYLRTSSRYVSYGPTVVLVALVLATSLPWQRKLWALWWGLLLVNVFIAVRLALTLTANGFAKAEKPYALFDPSPFWTNILVRVESVVSDNPTVSFVVPAFIWFVVALAWSDRSEPASGPKKQTTPSKADRS